MIFVRNLQNQLSARHQQDIGKTQKYTAMKENPRENKSTERREYTFDRVVRLVIGLGFTVGAIYLVVILRDVLLPFVVSWLIAYMLEPFVLFNKKLLRTRKRFLPVIVTLIEATAVLVSLGVIFLPSIIDEVHQLGQIISNYAHSNREISFIPASFHEFLRRNIDLQSISENLSRQDLQALTSGATKIISGGWTIVIGIFNWILVMLYVLFIMLDYERLLVGFKRLVPPKYRKTVYAVADDVKNSMNHYFRGQALIAVFVAIMFSVAFSIIGLPLAVLLGLMIGVMSMVPYLQLVSIIPTTLLCLVMAANGDADFWSIWWKCIIAYCIIQSIEDLVLTPRIMGKAMGLNPAIILLSLSVWGSLFGIVGMIIALPLTTLLISYYDRYVIRDPSASKDFSL